MAETTVTEQVSMSHSSTDPVSGTVGRPFSPPSEACAFGRAAVTGADGLGSLSRPSVGLCGRSGMRPGSTGSLSCLYRQENG